MLILTKEEFIAQKGEIMKKILEGSVFIYPTDTFYGIGCNATNENAVKKIRELKKRPNDPFSIIAPNKEWIVKNCNIEDVNQLSKLPGPYTFILELNNKKIISEAVNPDKKTIGIRIPDNWFSAIVTKIGVPIVTTSVNKSGETFMTNMDDLDEDIKNNVDFIIYEGPKKGKPSTIVSFEKDQMKFKLRQ
ncbi:MAG: L-threonylcarbamoyladenylate synthase [Nanoarchaeota archaeon]